MFKFNIKDEFFLKEIKEVGIFPDNDSNTIKIIGEIVGDKEIEWKEEILKIISSIGEDISNHKILLNPKNHFNSFEDYWSNQRDNENKDEELLEHLRWTLNIGRSFDFWLDEKKKDREWILKVRELFGENDDQNNLEITYNYLKMSECISYYYFKQIGFSRFDFNESFRNFYSNTKKRLKDFDEMEIIVGLLTSGIVINFKSNIFLPFII